MNRIGWWMIGWICLVVGSGAFGKPFVSPAMAIAEDGAEEGAEEEAGEDLIRLILDLLEDPDKEMRSLGLEQVRMEAKGKRATLRFAAQLPKLAVDAQVGLLGALAERQDKAARPAVLERFESSLQEPIRVAAIGALSTLGNLSDVERLVPLLVAASEGEKGAAKSGLIRMRGEKVPIAIAGQLAKASSQVSPELAVQLLEILVARRALDTTTDILSVSVDDNGAIRTAAMAALGHLAGPQHLPGMVRGVLRAEPGRERAAAEKAVMFVCGRIEDSQEWAEPLLAAIDRLEPAAQVDMLSTLGRVGGPQTLERIEIAIADTDPGHHEIGVRALCNWPDASIADRLIELAEGDADQGCRVSALRALIRVAPLRDSRSDEDRLSLLRRAMAMAERDTERTLGLYRARAIRTMDCLEFLLPYLDDPMYAQVACASIVELAHHRGLREPNKGPFHKALDKVIETTGDATVKDRANRYKQDKTWVRPK